MARLTQHAALWMAALATLGGCNLDPSDQLDEQVGYRTPEEGQGTSGERGNVVISEILWSGSVTDDGTWDPTDVFIEIRNQGSLPVNLSGWRLELEGSIETGWRIPASDLTLQAGEHRFVAAKTTGCFPEPDWVIDGLILPKGDPFRVTLLDADERLIEPAGSRTMPPFAGGYDLVRSRSMERVELMFGGRGNEPQSWHFYNEVEPDIPNNDRMADNCREFTLASPGRANSKDYSGALSAGGFE